MSRAKRIGVVLVIAATVAVGVGVVALWDTCLGRAVRGVSTLAVRNGTSEPLHDVVISATDQSRDYRHQAQCIEPGDTVRLTVRTSDLYLESVEWRCGAGDGRYDKPGLATRGEILMIEVLPGGTTRSYYVSD